MLFSDLEALGRAVRHGAGWRSGGGFWRIPRIALDCGQLRRRTLPDTCCPNCGFPLDPVNESQVVCPACGADPNSPPQPENDPEMAAALEDGAAFAETPESLSEMLGDDAPSEPEVDYVPDPDLDAAIAEGEALKEALTKGPNLVAGNKLIN
jgi:uncharacterized Zn finger protein (UPF0148 family)